MRLFVGALLGIARGESEPACLPNSSWNECGSNCPRVCGVEDVNVCIAVCVPRCEVGSKFAAWNKMTKSVTPASFYMNAVECVFLMMSAKMAKATLSRRKMELMVPMELFKKFFFAFSFLITLDISIFDIWHLTLQTWHLLISWNNNTRLHRHFIYILCKSIR